MRRAIWLGLSILALTCLLLALPLGTAIADVKYDLVLLNGGEEIPDVTFGDPVDGKPVYQVTYREGLALTVATTTQLGADVNYGTLKDSDGNAIQIIREVGTYTFSCVVSNQQFTAIIQVSPIPVTLQWVESSLSCEYGQTPAPQATVTSGQTGVTLRYRNVSGEGDFAVSGVGNYTVVCEAVGNYSGSISGTFVVSPSQAVITVTTPPTETVVWDGAYYVKTRFGVTVSEGYDALSLDKVKVIVGGAVVNSGVINAVGTYTVSFAFDDNNPDNFAYSNFNATDSYQLTIERAPLALVFEAGGMGVPYNPDPAYPQLVYDAFANGTVCFVSGDVEVEGLDNSLLDIVYLDADKEALEGGPVAVGDYYLRLSYPETSTYSAAQAVDVPFHIVRADVSSGITVKVDGTAVGIRTIKEFAYGEAFEYSFALPEVYADLANRTFGVYQRETAEGEWDNLDGVPQLPGSYRYRVTLTDVNVYADTYRSFVIQRAALVAEELEDLGVMAISTYYGMVIPFHPDIPEYEEDGTWIVMYEGEGYPRSAVYPRAVGVYDVYLSLEGDSLYTYSHLFNHALSIERRDVRLTVTDKTVAYGNAWSGTILRTDMDVTVNVDDEMGYYAIVEGDEEAILSALGLVAVDEDGNVYTQPTASMIAGNRYALRLVGEHPSYEIHGEDGTLNIGRRSLTVTADSLTVYKSSRERDLTLTLANVASWDDEEALAACFAVRIAGGLDWSEAMSAVSNLSLSYDLEAYKATDSTLLANYNPSYRAGKLTVRPTTLVTNDSDFGVEGQFSQEDSLTLIKGNPSSYSSVVKQVLRGYVARTVYEIRQTVSTERNTGIVVSIVAPQDAKILVSYDGVNFDEVDYTYVGGRAVFSQTVMATRYVICTKQDIPWLLIGACGGGGAGLILIIIVVAVILKKKNEKRQKEELQAVTTAPTKGLQHKSEEDELDELIENFDESTVQRELTPAERIALREKEEKYNQYRLRLQRMRGSGDKSMQDQLATLQLGAADDDAIIARMIAEDEAKAKALEEEILKEREEEENKPQAVILERKEGVLEQRSFAPTAKDDDDDFDI